MELDSFQKKKKKYSLRARVSNMDNSQVISWERIEILEENLFSLLSVLIRIFSFNYFSFVKYSRKRVAFISPYFFPFSLFLNKGLSPQKSRTLGLENFTHCWPYISVGLGTGNQKINMVPVKSKFSIHQSKETLKIPTPPSPTYTLSSTLLWKSKASRNLTH